MIKMPENVCYDNGILRWSPVDCADGYNIHADEKYIVSIHGQDASEFHIDDDRQLFVSAFVKGSECDIHTFKSPAVLKREPPKVEPELVFVEDFEKLCDDKWSTAFPWGPDQTINGELQYYPNYFGGDRPDHMPFVITDDGLQIIAKRRFMNGKEWTSGKICLIEPITGEFYVESEIKMEFNHGFWPAFWLVNYQYGGHESEIDIIEQPGFSPIDAHHSYHYKDAQYSPYQTQKNTSQTDTQEWHKYAVERLEHMVTWYVDDLPVHRVRDNLSLQDMRLILNLAVGGNWPGEPDTDVNESTMDIRYVKVWQNS